MQNNGNDSNIITHVTHLIWLRNQLLPNSKSNFIGEIYQHMSDNECNNTNITNIASIHLILLKY